MSNTPPCKHCVLQRNGSTRPLHAQKHACCCDPALVYRSWDEPHNSFALGFSCTSVGRNATVRVNYGPLQRVPAQTPTHIFRHQQLFHTPTRFSLILPLVHLRKPLHNLCLFSRKHREGFLIKNGRLAHTPQHLHRSHTPHHSTHIDCLHHSPKFTPLAHTTRQSISTPLINAAPST